MSDDKDLEVGRLVAKSGDRATDAPHGAASASPPLGSVSTGAEAGDFVLVLAELAELPDTLAASLRDHIRAMYPEVVAAAPSTFLISAGNHVRNLCHAAVIRLLDGVQSEVRADLARMGSSETRDVGGGRL